MNRREMLTACAMLALPHTKPEVVNGAGYNLDGYKAPFRCVQMPLGDTNAVYQIWDDNLAFLDQFHTPEIASMVCDYLNKNTVCGLTAR